MQCGMKFVSVWQGLIRSCHQETDALRSFIDFWRQILNCCSATELSSFSVEKRIRVRETVDEQFVKAVSSIVRRLDFPIGDALDDTSAGGDSPEGIVVVMATLV